MNDINEQLQDELESQVEDSVETQEKAPENNELVECQKTCSDLKAKYAYLSADFENFRRNTTKERAQWVHTAQGRVLNDLLTVADDFERAFADLQQAGDLSESETTRFQGFELIQKGLVKLLEQHGVVEIPADVPFDPVKHEAVMQVASDEIESGAVVQVFQKGYMHKDTVLRPAKVSVAQ